MFPITVDLGFRVMPFYEGLYFLIAIAGGVAWARHRIRKAGLSLPLFDRALVWILIGALVGARVFHFAFWDGARLAADPLVFFRFWEGGLTIVGGLVGGIGAGAWLLVRQKAPFWEYFAVVSPALLLGQALGRVGCFLNGDAWGTPTTLPWGVPMAKFATRIPSLQTDPSTVSLAWDWAYRHGYSGADTLATVPLHPAQLYEALADAVLLGLVLAAGRRVRAQTLDPRQIFWLHVGGYALIRFAVEFVHGDHETVDWAGMTVLQIGLAVTAVGCAIAARFPLSRRTP